MSSPARPYRRSRPAAPAVLAPYALVRSTVVARPAQSAQSAAVRTALTELCDLEAELEQLRPLLADDLYASRSGHGEEFHRRVVLPLRRDLHNGRPPRPLPADRLGDLPERLPRLARWLRGAARRQELLLALTVDVPPALAAERAALAALCREPAFTRAVATTSADLLRAVTATADGGPSARRPKGEAAVLRHVLRATCKTSPLSWFTSVGWSSGEPVDGEGESGHGLWNVVRENRTLVGALVLALLDLSRRRRSLPHRMASAADRGAGAEGGRDARAEGGGRVGYARTRTVFAGGRYLVAREERIELAARPELALLERLVADPEHPDRLAVRLAGALGRPAGDPAVGRFLDQLLDADLLVPVEPVDPQRPAPLAALADWLEQWPQDAELVRRIRRIDTATGAFRDAPAARRPAALDELAEQWRQLLAEAGRPVPADAAPLTVLGEDVHAPAPVGPVGSAADRAALAELGAVAELFDHGHLMRRAARDRFVARYGVGGVCTAPWEFGADTADAWSERRIPEELASLRAEFAGIEETDGELVLPAGAVRALADRLPDWTAARPLGYSWFVQRDAAGGLLCVNHVYGGWGRFTSRFLDADAHAGAGGSGAVGGRAGEVARQIRDGLGPGARAAQLRPVGGFNANLHPLLLPEEIGPDRHRTALAEADLDLVHDPASDQLRLRVRSSGEHLDVLYLGFLAPIMLPQRLGPLLNDHPNGVVDLRSWLPRTALPAPGGTVHRTPRLRHRHVVLARRRWHLPPAVLTALRTELADGERASGVPAAAVARWRARLGLPEQVFLHPVPAPADHDRAPAEAFAAHLRAAKPQPVDLGNPLHLLHLDRWLSRHPHGAVLEEALPAIGGDSEATHTVEYVLESHRPARDGRRPGRQEPRNEQAEQEEREEQAGQAGHALRERELAAVARTGNGR
ncbi:lantibiotic dehydratase [Kitasatospora sp. NPDC088391]|uniref:lantibiotic dehydratase n=1 Tax=Kitasatospora sp. NPDC088391 TaxID=3364074 RepID=UPI0038047C88